ncbi:hypothetical protein [Pseudoalteromonas atlantica]|uniref:hypothetical protein n=1 Tax=Pseudoalteromonas atlantica TaxID=288 RepID=UPI003735C321
MFKSKLAIATLIAIASSNASAHECECENHSNANNLRSQGDSWHFIPSISVSHGINDLTVDGAYANADFQMLGLSAMFSGQSFYTRLDLNVSLSGSFEGAGLNVGQSLTQKEVEILWANDYSVGDLDDNGNDEDYFSHADASLTIGYNIYNDLDIFVGVRFAEKEYGAADAFANSGAFFGSSYSYTINDNSAIGLSVTGAQLSAKLDREPFDGIEGDSFGYSLASTYSYLFSENAGLSVKLKYESFSYTIDDDRFSNQVYANLSPEVLPIIQRLDPGNEIEEKNTTFAVSMFYMF